MLVNAAVERLTGYRRDELLGQSMEILTPEELRSRHAGHRDAYWANPVTAAYGNRVGTACAAQGWVADAGGNQP